ncbi:hypothetical protein [Pedobacter metabolipauper]|uniref:Uncharacterized protein n=1 Tax=Pedobacter metabolipauper TaxID=425513 RepID=A0A4R6T484_9SPHI|nr:hypothetical protein [Pedobacter metabolipauper]TDQ12191.1 hypothetical protein ATK78_1325 [Pedobacter metabolipauper]
MTLGEFKKKTEHLPDHIEMMMAEVETGFKYSPVESATVQDINFSEEPDGSGASAKETVLILDGI